MEIIDRVLLSEPSPNHDQEGKSTNRHHGAVREPQTFRGSNIQLFITLIGRLEMHKIARYPRYVEQGLAQAAANQKHQNRDDAAQDRGRQKNPETIGGA